MELVSVVSDSGTVVIGGWEVQYKKVRTPGGNHYFAATGIREVGSESEFSPSPPECRSEIRPEFEAKVGKPVFFS